MVKAGGAGADGAVADGARAVRADARDVVGEVRTQRGVDGRPQVRRARKDGWTVRRQRVFLDHLRATCNVRFSAAQAGLSATGAYNRARIDGAFREAWREALKEGYVRIETMLIARAGGTHDALALGRAADAAEADEADALEDLTESLDTPLALALLANHRKAIHGGVRRTGGRAPTAASMEQVTAAILKQLDALARRRAAEAARPEGGGTAAAAALADARRSRGEA